MPTCISQKWFHVCIKTATSIHQFANRMFQITFWQRNGILLAVPIRMWQKTDLFVTQKPNEYALELIDHQQNKGSSFSTCICLLHSNKCVGPRSNSKSLVQHLRNLILRMQMYLKRMPNQEEQCFCPTEENIRLGVCDVPFSISFHLACWQVHT